MAETRKAHPRRQREGFYAAYCQGQGIDIGVGRIDTFDGEDALPVPGIHTWDKDNGDATFMHGVANESYDFVYTSHILEHIANATLGLKNWWRILKPGGYLILYAPHRDLYEKRRELPSIWNWDHKFFLLPEDDDLPFTLGLKPLVLGALSAESLEIISLRTCDEGHTITDPSLHSDGEYSIEMVVRKRILT
ncbi:MAG: class I SAM-dependent methyltransferase [Fimbriimonadaceae bacterium]|nr:class I SAM-dependent methyltransferase [Fimbriimonadaceae bacterium]